MARSFGEAMVACADADTARRRVERHETPGIAEPRLAVLHHVLERALQLPAALVERWIRSQGGRRAPAKEAPHLHQCRRRARHRVRPPPDHQVVADDVLRAKRAERFRQVEADLRRAAGRHRRPARIVRDRVPPVRALHVIRGNQRHQRVAPDTLVVFARQRPVRADEQGVGRALVEGALDEERRRPEVVLVADPARRLAASARSIATSALKSSRRSRVDVFARDSKCEHRHASAISAVSREAWYAALTITDSSTSLRTFSPSDSKGRVFTVIRFEVISSAAFSSPVSGSYESEPVLSSSATLETFTMPSRLTRHAVRRSRVRRMPVCTRRIPGADADGGCLERREPAAQRIGHGAAPGRVERAHVEVEREQRLTVPDRRELELGRDAQRPVDALRDGLLQRLNLLVVQVGVDERLEVGFRVGADRVRNFVTTSLSRIVAATPTDAAALISRLLPVRR